MRWFCSWALLTGPPSRAPCCQFKETLGGGVAAQNLLSSCPGSAETVNDGHFHTVELLSFERSLNLSVDGGEPTTLEPGQRRRSSSSSGSPAPGAEAPLYVGGESSRPGASSSSSLAPPAG